LELDAVSDRVVADDDFLEAQGINVQLVGVEISDNVVDVGVLDLTAAKRAFLETRYGPSVRVRSERIQSAASPRSHYFNPVVGGMKIVGPNECTSAFPAKAGYVVGAGGEEFTVVFTAGHCAPLNATWYQGGDVLGSVYRRRFGGQVDAEIIRTNRSGISSVFLTRRRNQPIDRLQKAGDDDVGNDVCHSGHRGRPRCGKLTSRAMAIKVDGEDLVAQREFRPYSGSGVRDFCKPGDSGAPTYFGRVAKGIVSAIATESRRCYYTHIDHAFRALVTGTG
jgi:hypothetical protein